MRGSMYFSVGYHSAQSTFGHLKLEPKIKVVEEFLQENETMYSEKQLADFKNGVMTFFADHRKEVEEEERKKSLLLYNRKENKNHALKLQEETSIWCALSVFFFGHA